jgi:T5orf172 domain
MQRLNVEDVRKIFRNKGDTLISKEYKDSKTKLDYICKNGHVCSIKWNNYQQGQTCLECKGIKRQTKKPTIEFIRSAFEINGDKLLSQEYTNNKRTLNYACQKGHKTQITWSSYQSGNRCLECSGSAKYSISQVSDVFNQNGDKLISTQYLNRKALLVYCCKNGHEQTARFDVYRRGRKCSVCKDEAISDIKRIRSVFEERGDKLICLQYNPKEKLNYVCKNGHSHSIFFSQYKFGKGCLFCAVTGFDFDKPAILYYVCFNHNEHFYYKIGVTNNTVTRRFRYAKIKPRIVYKQQYSKGLDAFEREQELLKRFNSFRLSKKSFAEDLDFLGKANGHTELFDFDVLNLDHGH